MNPEKNQDRDMGAQPLDKILDDLDLANSDLVAASTEQLTHKQVAKSRKGRRVTPNIQQKIANALAACEGGSGYQIGDLFTY